MAALALLVPVAVTVFLDRQKRNEVRGCLGTNFYFFSRRRKSSLFLPSTWKKTKLPRLTLGSIAIPQATWPRLVAQLILCVSSTLSIPGVVWVALVEHAFGYQDVGHRAGGHLEV